MLPLIDQAIIILVLHLLNTVTGIAQIIGICDEDQEIPQQATG